MNLDLHLKSSSHGYSFAPVNSYNFSSAHRAAAYTQPNLNAEGNLISLKFSVSLKVAKLISIISDQT